MTQEKLIDAITDLDSDILNRYFDMKADLAAKKKPKKRTWVKWASLAACLCLVVGVAFRIAIGFVPNQATDIYREGTLIEITSESDLPAQYDGKLLAFNLECSQYEFYYKQDGSAENTEDWYSLLQARNTMLKRKDESLCTVCLEIPRLMIGNSAVYLPKKQPKRSM